MKYLLFTFAVLILFSCNTEKYNYYDRIEISTTKEAQKSDIEKIKGFVKSIDKEAMKARLAEVFPDALTVYSDNIYLQIKKKISSVKVSDRSGKSEVKSYAVIVEVQMNYDNQRSEEASKILKF